MGPAQRSIARHRLTATLPTSPCRHAPNLRPRAVVRCRGSRRPYATTQPPRSGRKEWPAACRPPYLEADNETLIPHAAGVFVTLPAWIIPWLIKEAPLRSWCRPASSSTACSGRIGSSPWSSFSWSRLPSMMAASCSPSRSTTCTSSRPRSPKRSKGGVLRDRSTIQGQCRRRSQAALR